MTPFLTLDVRNVNHALPRALAELRSSGVRISPRGIETIEFPTPVVTHYRYPHEMVLFDPVRDANPFFHMFESLWILAGRRDVEFLKAFVGRMVDFSDDGFTYHGAYGYRLRHAFGFDQIERAVEILRNDHDSRQVVLSIWNPNTDLGTKTKDMPCNDTIALKVRDGALRMTVFNRSNDVIWGAYGANVVQFSSLLMYFANRIGVAPGTYTQVSDSFHVYTDNPFWQAWCKATPPGHVPAPNDYYEQSVLTPSVWMVGATGEIDSDLQMFFAFWDRNERAAITEAIWFKSPMFRDTVAPAFEAFMEWKYGNRALAVRMVERVSSSDWRTAMTMWMQRRLGNG